MNNASLLLNAARPATKAATPEPASGGHDDTRSTQFSTAMDAAHATARHASSASKDSAPTMSARPVAKKPEGVAHTHDTTHGKAKAADDTSSSSSTASGSASASSDTGADAKDDATAKAKDADQDAGKAGASQGDDTSLAASVLALIGVPTAVTQVAAKALGAAKDALTGQTGDAVGGLAAAKDAGLNALGLNATASTDTAAPTTGLGSPFAALLATPAAGDGKDRTAGVDLGSTSPMPFAHAQLQGQDGTTMQLQSTQAATSPQFAQELGEQIAWMGSAAGSVKEARIKLHPEELGSMDVRVSMDGGKVNVAIMAQHPAAVHAVQQTLSNLDSMLAHHGLSLGQASVNQGNAQQNGSGQAQGQTGQGSDADAGSDAVATVATSSVSRGLLNEVA
ncbi:flagellar hook-length control protein FliK [Bacillus sp. NP157]|nr:flagellar hook-length control protein FliK [Bacillus sp. NP157]